MDNNKYIVWNPPKILRFLLNDTYYVPIDKLINTEKNQKFFHHITFYKSIKTLYN